ncbi:MAG: hypothetical protein ACE5KU_04115, partial [Nitrososphaerales archaeon]
SSILLIILSIVVVAFGFSEFYVNDPSSNVICTTCHSMTPFRDTWLTSSHSRFSCYTCHETGIAELTNELYVYLTENPHPSDIEEGKLLLRYQCLTCHKPKSLQSNLKLHNVHWNLVEEVETCTLCHTSHILTPRTEACLGCHGSERSASIHEEFHIEANKRLSRGEIICQNCHSTAARWMIPLNRPSIMGAAEGRDCFDCHAAPLRPVNIRDRSCLECHAGG